MANNFCKLTKTEVILHTYLCMAVYIHTYNEWTIYRFRIWFTILMSFCSVTKFSILSPLNVLNRFMHEQGWYLLDTFVPKTISLKLHEYVVQNLVAEKHHQCPLYESLLLKFVKLISLWMRQDVSLFVQCAHPENIEIVAESVNTSPSTSARQRSQELNISSTSIHRILRKNLSMTPYRVQFIHYMTIRFVLLRYIGGNKKLSYDFIFAKKKKKIIFSDGSNF